MPSTLPYIPSAADAAAQYELLVPLDEWAKQHVTALYSASDANELDHVLDKFITNIEDQRTITTNGRSISRDQYKEELQETRAGVSAEDVQFTSVQVTPGDTENPFLAGDVNVTFRVKNEKTTLHLTVFQDETLRAPRIPLSGRPGFIDRRRVSKLVSQS